MKGHEKGNRCVKNIVRFLITGCFCNASSKARSKMEVLNAPSCSKYFWRKSKEIIFDPFGGWLMIVKSVELYFGKMSMEILNRH